MSTEHTLAENLLRLQSATEDIADAITEKGGTASYSDGLEAMASKILLIPTPQQILTTKSITSNGTYNASSDSADGYSEVTVAVPNTYAAGDEGKVVQSGALVSQTTKNITTNGTYNTTTNNSCVVNVEGSGTAVNGTITYTSNSSFTIEGYYSSGGDISHNLYAIGLNGMIIISGGMKITVPQKPVDISKGTTNFTVTGIPIPSGKTLHAEGYAQTSGYHAAYKQDLSDYFSVNANTNTLYFKSAQYRSDYNVLIRYYFICIYFT